MFSYEIFAAGEDVFCEYDAAASMSICLCGNFDISTNSVDSQSQSPRPQVEELRDVVNKFAHVKPGDYFGEMSLLIDMPRLATVTASEKSLLATVSKADFRNFIKAVPEMGRHLYTDVQKRMMERLYACQIPFFSGITLEQVGACVLMCSITK